MSEQGYIKISRKLFEHRLWCDEREFSTFEAWLDLIRSARFEDATQNIGKYQSQLVKRGQFLASIRFLAQRWRWSVKRVLRYLQYLEEQQMIHKETAKETGVTVITLSNYDTYNHQDNSKETLKATARKHQGNSRETNISNYKELKETINNNTPLPPIGASGALSSDDLGFSLVSEKGSPPGSAAPPSNSESDFEEFRRAYIGSKRGLRTEFDNFRKHNKDYKTILPLLLPALNNLLAWRERARRSGSFVPEVPNLQTWINQRRWETEYPTEQNTTNSNNNGTSNDRSSNGALAAVSTDWSGTKSTI